MNNFHQSKVCWQEARGVSEISSYFRIVCKHRHLCIFAPQCYIVWLQRGVLSLLFWQNVQKCLLVDSFSMTLQDRYILMFLTDLSFSVYKWVLAATRWAAGGKWVWKRVDRHKTLNSKSGWLAMHCLQPLREISWTRWWSVWGVRCPPAQMIHHSDGREDPPQPTHNL